jgi:hypothetical protein
MTHFGRPPGPAPHQSIKRPRLTLERQHDVKAAARPQHARHLAKNLVRVVDVLEHIKDPDEIELAI